ncbi:unannotated protein [freshwater metagenome]|uniref:Unannotated protein n=1 Tax=freshwater metagenome TaxID=449393 RepID=A0A6J7FFK8_9ZZZZ
MSAEVEHQHVRRVGEGVERTHEREQRVVLVDRLDGCSQACRRREIRVAQGASLAPGDDDGVEGAARSDAVGQVVHRTVRIGELEIDGLDDAAVTIGVGDAQGVRLHGHAADWSHRVLSFDCLPYEQTIGTYRTHARCGRNEQTGRKPTCGT